MKNNRQSSILSGINSLDDISIEEIVRWFDIFNFTITMAHSEWIEILPLVSFAAFVHQLREEIFNLLLCPQTIAYIWSYLSPIPILRHVVFLTSIGHRSVVWTQIIGSAFFDCDTMWNVFKCMILPCKSLTLDEFSLEQKTWNCC